MAADCAKKKQSKITVVSSACDFQMAECCDSDKMPGYQWPNSALAPQHRAKGVKARASCPEEEEEDEYQDRKQSAELAVVGAASNQQQQQLQEQQLLLLRCEF